MKFSDNNAILYMFQEHKLHTIRTIHKTHGIIEMAEQNHKINQKNAKRKKKENWMHESNIQTRPKSAAYNFQAAVAYSNTTPNNKRRTEMFQQTKY